MASFGYGFPPNIFNFYLGDFKHTHLTPDAVESLRACLLANGLLIRSGQQTLKVDVTSQNEQELLALLDVMLQAIEQPAMSD